MLSDNPVWLFLKEKYEVRKPFETEAEAWVDGYMSGMAKAVEIESASHEPTRKRKEVKP